VGVPEIVVDPGRAVPPYEQIRQQIAELILAGVLAPHERLPPVRHLAADLGLATGTVARAYHELETAGLVHSRRGGGTRVAAAPPPEPAKRRAALLAARTRAYVLDVRRLGATDAELRAALATELAAPQ